MSWMEKVADRAALFASTSWGISAVLFLFAFSLVWGAVVDWAEAWFIFEIAAWAITLAMLFFLKRAQTKDSMAVHLKLNELLAALHRASPRLINVESLSEEDIHRLRDGYDELREAGPGSHSVEDVDTVVVPQSR
jgi:low affinity Fe/Cu permease